MEIEDFQALLAPQGQEALEMAVARAPREEDFLGHFTALSRRFPAALARAALEQAILRLEASPKFPFAARMYFTRQALEQATSYQISTYRAGRFHPFSRLLDLGCSLGGDTLSLCQVAPTIGVDLDALRLALAQANLQALGLQERVAFLCADLNKQLPMRIGRDTGVFFDPARRTQTRRVYSVHDYQPALSSIQSWLMDAPALGVKISPGVKLEELAPYEAEVEFISLDGELKEAVLWFGSLKSARRRATLLPGGYTLAAYPDDPDRPEFPLNEPLDYLYEPDPAVLRAGLVQALGEHLSAMQLDPQIAYLTAEKLTPSPFARAWRVDAWFPFSLKRLRAELRARHVGQAIIKKRGSPLDPDQLRRDLRLSGDQERVVFLTHLRGKPIAILAFAKGEPTGY